MMTPAEFLPTIDMGEKTPISVLDHKAEIVKVKELEKKSIDNSLNEYKITFSNQEKAVHVFAHNYYISNGFVIFCKRSIIPKSNEVMQTAIYSCRLDNIDNISI
jgi:aromatic ring-opening dioxygenase LigB subunit